MLVLSLYTLHEIPNLTEYGPLLDALGLLVDLQLGARVALHLLISKQRSNSYGDFNVGQLHF